MTMLGFLQGEEKDNKGRYLFDYWVADNQWLEETHDYIQWMFPLDVRSFHHPFVAPALKNDEIEIAKHDESIQNNMIMSFQRILEFYGLRLNEVENKIEKNDSFQERSKVWLVVKNHNHLRLTRIIKSMRLLGLETYAEMLLDFLIELVSEVDCFTKTTRSIWMELKIKK